MQVRVRGYNRRVPLRRRTTQESALEDFMLEDEFADRFLAGKVTLGQFPLYQSYVDTIAAERTLLKSPKHILFIGSGPVPMSAILYARMYQGARVDIVDIDAPALEKGARVAKKYGVNFGKKIHSDAAALGPLKEYDAIVVALEAGDTPERKEAVLGNIVAQSKRTATILVRSSLTDEFVRSRQVLPPGTKVVGSVETFGGLSETLAVRK